MLAVSQGAVVGIHMEVRFSIVKSHISQREFGYVSVHLHVSFEIFTVSKWHKVSFGAR